jgi:serine phosphatase RsbU (regulator of sigma subunit)
VLDVISLLGGEDDLATVWVGVYDADTGLLRYASAGHPPPVFAEIGRPPRLLEAASAPPLGTGAVAGHAQVHELRWPAGALLVAYSDGLVERRERDLEQQIHRLCESVGFFGAALGSQANPRELTEALLAAGVSDLASPTDDLCVLVVRRDASAVTADGSPEPVQDVRDFVGLR